ncbi:MAG TPA: penicillin-binding protein 2 [Gaiellaceae bacterium]
MNARIRIAALTSLTMLVALIVASTYWQAWAAPDLANKSDNSIRQISEFTIDRGRIFAADGTTLAKNRIVHSGGRTYYFRRYPLGSLTAAAVGYATQTRSRAGLERSANDYLTGANQSLSGAIKQIGDRLLGSTIRGSDVYTSLNLNAQRIATQALGSNCGAAVAIEPSTGRVLALVTSPTYNPNDVEGHFDRIRKIRSSSCSPASPLLDRATQGLYPPGSAFKTVTAAAALDTGRFTPSSIFHDPGYCIEYGQQVRNFSDQSGPEVFGTLSLATGFQNSVNSVFCNIGKTLGINTLMNYARRFGFDNKPSIDLPSDALAASGLYKRSLLLNPSEEEHYGDPGRTAFGQDKLLVTPLQMAIVAATIANNGTLMRTHLVDRVRRSNGGLVRIKPETLGQAIKPETALELTQMMESVVTSGTGTAAAIPGVKVAGKTGTAENGTGQPNTTWFISFAPADAPRVAVAVVLQNQTGVGGTTAAPIARQIMQAILTKTANSNP